MVCRIEQENKELKEKIKELEQVIQSLKEKLCDMLSRE